ncbi:hypothetical protein [Flavobacterium sp. HTF]|uniref:DUF6712 family protein n=1 Tax=Flavobacterium sp. HTF TaxID=2170732 RepID=UPI000D5F8195|nr:hypothetical protein [Flavobacterium sp. HTF]PWB24657.1 hypothetical protein DCO46_11105 [Flavobacterium sp. HTF]
MNNLLTPEQIQSFKDIGEKIDVKKINPIIEQAQTVDLKSTLGDRFYFDVLANKDNPDYAPLFSGCSFTYFDINYYQDGLNSLLADYFMSKYVLQINTNFTPFGATIKLGANGEPADRNSLKDISTQQLQLAGSRWEIIYLYLNANPSLFPNWKNNIYSSESAPAGDRTFRFRKI